jgi:hypothetical protein
MACSREATEVNNVSAQQMYNEMRGTYVGNIMVDNIPQKVYVTIGDDFTVSQLPLKPILERLITDNSELNEAIESADNTTFTAPTDNMTVSGNYVLLTMTTSDILFTIQVGGQSKQVSAMIASVAEVNTYSKELSLYMEVKDLYYNGQSYDVSKNRITYYLDIADKVVTE